MRLVCQRVKSARVIKVDTGEVAGEIGLGLLVLLGVGKKDTKKDADTLAEKLFKLRVMADKNGKMNLSVGEVNGSFLIVSQFTLYADTSSGNRPSFIEAGEPGKARELYKYFVEKLEDKGAKVKIGSFGDYMKIDAALDGPVTILY